MLVAFFSTLIAAQQKVQRTQTLPSAPTPQLTAAQNQSGAAQLAQAQAAQPKSGAGQFINSPQILTLQQARGLAVKNNPQISVAHLLALASHQQTREIRSNLWPTATVNLTGVDAESGTRITAGALNNPVIYERAAFGTQVSQLIYDFGRTSNLVSSANYAEKAQNQDAAATREQILLAVDQAFYNALQAQAVVTVAQQTVTQRQTVSNQVNELFKNKLKSELDLSFANVNLAQAKLLLLDAQNARDAALAQLSMVLGFSNLQNYRLAEDTSTTTAPPSNVDDLIATAFSMRPEILALQFQVQSAQKFCVAERDLLLPSIRAVGVVGDTPFGNPVVADTWYGAVGANLDIPVFNGFLYRAREREARLREEASNERLRAMRDQISRDVRTSWLNANATYQRLDVTQQLFQQANLGLTLAQTRYKMGLSSIVELSQAQLQQTQAQISYVQAGYDYRLAQATLTFETKGL
ncbi:MAG TPA: TolC family protein [Terriglobales bacterium]|nr:TolC family protein [Terriglobales bacterium]